MPNGAGPAGTRARRGSALYLQAPTPCSGTRHRKTPFVFSFPRPGDTPHCIHYLTPIRGGPGSCRRNEVMVGASSTSDLFEYCSSLCCWGHSLFAKRARQLTILKKRAKCHRFRLLYVTAGYRATPSLPPFSYSLHFLSFSLYASVSVLALLSGW